MVSLAQTNKFANVANQPISAIKLELHFTRTGFTCAVFFIAGIKRQNRLIVICLTCLGILERRGWWWIEGYDAVGDRRWQSLHFV